MNEPRIFQNPGSVPTKLSSVLAAASIFIMVVLPFALTLITGIKEKIVALGIITIVQALLAVQVVSREASLESVIMVTGMEDDRTDERRKIAHDAVLLAAIALLMAAASIAGTLSGWFPKVESSYNYISEIVLSILGLSVLLIRNRKILLMAILLESPIFVAFGHYGLIDTIRIALWQTIFSAVVLQLTIEIQGRELVHMARTAVVESALSRDVTTTTP